MAKRKAFFLVPLGGILGALCLIFPKIGFLQWVAMVPALLYILAFLERAQVHRLRRAFGIGFVYFFSFYFVIFHWFLYLYPMEFAGVTKPEAAVLVLICWLGLTLLQTLGAAWVFLPLALLSRGRILRRRAVLLPFFFALAYVTAEWCQTLTFLGVPWARLALGQLYCGFLKNSLSLFGSYFLTFAIVSVNALIAYALLHCDRRRVCAIAAAVVFLCNATAGLIGYLTADVQAGEPVVAAVVQGNVGSSQKWSSESNRLTFEVYEKYTAEAVAAGAEIVIFPETFLPYSFTAVEDYVVGLATTYRVTVMCGAFHSSDEGEYNAIFTVYADGTVEETVYAKRHLVPFGEYLPMRTLIETLIPPLADINMLSYDLLPGTDSAIIDTPHGRLGGLLCFDSIYENLVRDSVRDGAQILVLPTNDSWFTDSAGVYMHSGQARLRAIESGRWILRSADTGISSIIDPRGNSFGEVPPLEEGVCIYTAYTSDARTLYSYIGNLFVYLLFAAFAFLSALEAFLFVRERRRALK